MKWVILPAQCTAPMAEKADDGYYGMSSQDVLRELICAAPHPEDDEELISAMGKHLYESTISPPRVKWEEIDQPNNWTQYASAALRFLSDVKMEDLE